MTKAGKAQKAGELWRLEADADTLDALLKQARDGVVQLERGCVRAAVLRLILERIRRRAKRF